MFINYRLIRPYIATLFMSWPLTLTCPPLRWRGGAQRCDRCPRGCPVDATTATEHSTSSPGSAPLDGAHSDHWSRPHACLDLWRLSNRRRHWDLFRGTVSHLTVVVILVCRRQDSEATSGHTTLPGSFCWSVSQFLPASVSDRYGSGGGKSIGTGARYPKSLHTCWQSCESIDGAH